ncbi:MAG: hypothetical protein MI919_19860, partial [Holophagales bacterium]|nr:hypothetical protein [Holophagales bacterium]
LGLGRDAEPVLRPVREHRRLAGAPVLARALLPLASSVDLLTLTDPRCLESELPGVGLQARPPAAGEALRRRRFVDAADGRVWLTTIGGTGGDARDAAWISDRLAEMAPASDTLLVVDQGQTSLVPEPLDRAGVHVAHLPDEGPALPSADLVLWRQADRQHRTNTDTRTVGRLARGGAAELHRGGHATTAPGFGESGASGPEPSTESSDAAFAAVCCLADAAGAEPELTLLAAQAGRLLAATGDPAPSRERLLKQLTSMLK